MNLKNIKSILEDIKSRGYIKSLRKGPTGVGYTVEKTIGIKENNIIIPDFGAIELKATREESSNLITLLTFNR